MTKIDVTLTSSTKLGDHTESWRIEVRKGLTTYRAMTLPKGIRGRLAEWLGLPPLVTIEVSPAKPGRKAKA